MSKKVRRDFSPIKTHLIRDRRYRVKWRRESSKTWLTDGKVDHPDSPDKVLYVYPHTRNPLSLLDTVYHEHIHAGLPDINEDAVKEICASAMRLLKRMGIRISFENEGR